MKKYVLAICIALGINSVSNAQFLSQSDIQKIKKAKLLIVKSGDAKLDEDMQASLKELWKFSPLGEVVTLEEAKKQSKENEEVMYITLEHVESKSLTHGSIPPSERNNPAAKSIYLHRTVSTGTMLTIKQNKSGYASVFLPAFSNKITKEILYFGISDLQCVVSMIDTKQLKNGFKVNSNFKETYTPELKKKTLYILEDWLNPKFTEKDVKTLYKAPAKVVDYFEWKDAILNKTPGIAYSIVVPNPSGGEYTYHHYLMDAETGNVLAISKINASVKIAGISVTQGNTGYITDKNLKNYNEAQLGDW